MIKRINRTRRARIERKHIDLSLRPSQGGEAPVFDLSLHLEEYGFPPEASVRVEAWRGNSVQRWDYGTVGRLAPPSDGERRMTAVPVGAQFRISVVAGDGSGRLLGHAASIKPVLPLNSRLPLEESENLGQEVWRVDFGGERGIPVLQVNAAIPGISEIVRNDASFRALVMPEVFRSILTRMVLIDRADGEDEDEPWADWFQLARAYYDKGEPPVLPGGTADSDEIENAREWVDAVVGALAGDPLAAANSYASTLNGDNP